MKSIKSIKPDEISETSLLLEFVRQGDLAVKEGRCKPLKQVFAELRERIKRMKTLHESIFNNNYTGSRERHQ